MRGKQTEDVRVDVDSLHRRAARQADVADAAVDCADRLRSGGFGKWWRDGRRSALDAHLAALADQLDAASSDVDEFTTGMRRTVTELAAADDHAARGLT